MTDASVVASRLYTERKVRYTLFIARGRWQLAVLVSVLVGALFMPLYENDSLWLGPGVASMALIGWHSLVAGRRLPWIPGLALATAALQWLVAPWITYHIGPAFQRFEMVIPAEEYFAFAVPAFCALAAGMLGVLRRPGRAAPPVASATGRMPLRFRRTCDGMVVIGVVTHLILGPLLGGSSVAFIGDLVGNLSFVGALALLLARAPGWPLRALLVLGAQGLISAANGMFHDLVLWVAYFCLTLIYVYTLRPRTISILIGTGAAAIMILNVAKQEFRQALASNEVGLFGSAALLSSTMIENADPEQAYEGTGFKFNVTRMNQGWIIARILYWVPRNEPYARGETVKATLRATFLPRILDPGKLEIGGHTYFERFTGLPLMRTSMDLSIAGEMYANFGYWGGILGVFIFGAFIGGVFRVFLRLAYQSPLWWAWAPFVLLYSTMAENSLASVTNHVAKSSLVMMAVISLVPAWAMLRRSLRARIERTLHLPVPRKAPGAQPAGIPSLRSDGQRGTR